MRTGILSLEIYGSFGRYALSQLVPDEIAELIEIKRKAEHQELAPDQVIAWRARLAAAIEAIDAAVPTSVLPSDPPPAVIAAIDAWLRGVRKRLVTPMTGIVVAGAQWYLRADGRRRAETYQLCRVHRHRER